MGAPSQLLTRTCPFCGSRSSTLLLSLVAADFCEINWSYAKNYREIVDILNEDSFPIDRCDSCGFVFARYLLSDNLMEKVYEEVIDVRLVEKTICESRDLVRRLSYIIQLVRLLPPQVHNKVLDYGCGFGRTSAILADLGFDVTAYDPSPKRREVIKRRFDKVRTISGEKSLRNQAPYDAVILDNILEHVPEPRSLIRTLATMSKLGTWVFVSVPSFEKEKWRMRIADCRNRALMDMAVNPWEHLNYFDLEHLDQMMYNEGFWPVVGAHLKGPVEIGLRPEESFVPRFKNMLASFARLVRYGFCGSTVDSTEQRFYRYDLKKDDTCAA